MLQKNYPAFKVAAAIIIAVLLFVAVNVIGDNVFKRFDLDLTEDSIFALSQGTKNIVGEIKEPVTFRFFYSRKASNGYPLLKSHAERIKGVLERYVGVANGKIKLQIIDPEAFTDDEDLAVGYGIKGIQLTSNSDEKLYLGLAISNARDDTRVVGFFHPDRQRFVEYEITKAVYDLAQQRRPVIGLLSTIEMESKPMLGIPGLGGGQGWLFLEQLKQGFDIENLDKNVTKIADNIDVLMVVQPQGFSMETMSAIDQFVLGGGKAMVFVDPNKEGVGTGNENDRSFSAEFNRLLGAWGVEIANDAIVADRMAARPVAQGEDGKGKVEYIAWLNIEKAGLSSDDITTSALKNINFATAGSISNLQVGGMDVVPLIKTSAQSMRIASSIVRGAPDPNKLLSNFVSDNKQYVLAARLSGRASTAFPGYVANGGLSQSKGDINVVVVADTDLLRDDVWAQVQDVQGYKVVMQNGDNSSFVTNVMELLSGSNELIALRGRGAATRPFTVVENIKRKAEEKYLAKEKELKDTLAQTEGRLEQLKKQAEAEAGNKLAYQGQQQREISAFSEQMAAVRKELRGVQFELKKDVSRLGSILKFINIMLVPLLIGVLAVFVFWYKGTRTA